MVRTWTFVAPLLLSTAVVGASPPARAATTVYTNEAAFLAAAGTPTTVDFDSLLDGDAIAGQFAAEGVTFEGFNGGTANTRAMTIPPFCMDNHSEPLSFQTVSDTQPGGGFQTSFAPPVDAVGLWIGDLQALSGNTTLTLLDASNQSLGSFDLVTQLGDSPCVWKFFGVTSDVPIYAVTVSISPFDYVLFDDLYFVTSPTAVHSLRLPGLVALALGLFLAAGRAGLGCAHRHRQELPRLRRWTPQALGSAAGDGFRWRERRPAKRRPQLARLAKR